MALQGRFGGRASPHLAQDAEMAFGNRLPAKDSLAGQKKQLEDQEKVGQLSKEDFGKRLAKLEDPDAVIDYTKTPQEFETGGNVSTRGQEAPLRGRHGGRASGIGGGYADNVYNPSPNTKTWQGQDKGRFGGRPSPHTSHDALPVSDATLSPSEQTRFDMLKDKRDNGILSRGEQQEFETLRDKIGRVGFKSAGAVRAKDKKGMATDPPVSEAQRRAMWAAKSGKSNIGIPKSVGAEFAGADPGGKLPERAK